MSSASSTSHPATAAASIGSRYAPRTDAASRLTFCEVPRGRSGFLALDDDARRRLETRRRHVRDVRHERRSERRSGGDLLVIDRQDPEPAELRELVADVGLEHL